MPMYIACIREAVDTNCHFLCHALAIHKDRVAWSEVSTVYNFSTQRGVDVTSIVDSLKFWLSTIHFSPRVVKSLFLKVVLHKAIRYPTVQQHYFRVPLGKSVIVAVTPTQMITSEKVKQYNIRKRKCVFQNEVNLKYFGHYTQFNCKLECWADYTFQRCGCVAYFMPRK